MYSVSNLNVDVRRTCGKFSQSSQSLLFDSFLIALLQSWEGLTERIIGRTIAILPSGVLDILGPTVCLFWRPRGPHCTGPLRLKLHLCDRCNKRMILIQMCFVEMTLEISCLSIKT